MLQDISYVLLSEEQIQTRVKELAAQLSAEYAGKNPIFVGVLKGVVIFYADFIKNFTEHCQMDFMWISSYSGTDSSGKMKVLQGLSQNIEGRHVVILEDIFDTGSSLQYTYDYLMNLKPASLKICTLLDKPERRREGITVKCDYTGFVIPNEFVVGYGLDFNEHYRNLPFVGVLKPEAYEK
jgi:hypoxanthine phosphoribosyltransferase